MGMSEGGLPAALASGAAGRRTLGPLRLAEPGRRWCCRPCGVLGPERGVTGIWKVCPAPKSIKSISSGSSAGGAAGASVCRGAGLAGRPSCCPDPARCPADPSRRGPCGLAAAAVAGAGSAAFSGVMEEGSASQMVPLSSKLWSGPGSSRLMLWVCPSSNVCWGPLPAPCRLPQNCPASETPVLVRSTPLAWAADDDDDSSAATLRAL